jgi:ATP-binding protein involved in chromosome partitioning
MIDLLNSRLYPGFDLSFNQLNAVQKNEKGKVSIVDYSNMIWVREAITHLIKELNKDLVVEFVTPDDKQRSFARQVLGIELSIEDSKKNFNKNKRIIGISSGKGGVGKSTSSAMLALAMTHEFGQKIGVMDADIWGYSIPKMLGAIFPPIPFEGRIIPSYTHGVKVISMDYFVKKGEAVIWRGPMLHKAIEQFLYEVVWQDIDFLLIDMPPGTGDVSISLSQFLSITETLIITTPQKTSSDVAQRAGIMANKVKSEVIGVIENMSYIQVGKEKLFPFGEGGGRLLAENLKTNFLGSVPLDPEVGRLADSGDLISSKKSTVYKSFVEIAESIIKIKPKKIPLNISIN